jgi:hypothetical protein
MFHKICLACFWIELIMTIWFLSCFVGTGDLNEAYFKINNNRYLMIGVIEK